MDSVPLQPTINISCVMPTTVKRLWCIPRSIRCWLRQTWQTRDLLVVSDGTEEDCKQVAKAINEGCGGFRSRIRHLHLFKKPETLGEKYNLGIAAAEGPYIALWADDDWNAPERLEFVMRGILKMGVRMAGSRTMICHRMRDKTNWLYMSAPQLPHLISGTMIFHKDVWIKKPWPHVQSGSDTTWVFSVLWSTETDEKGEPIGGEEYALTDDPRIYVAFVHDDCTGNQLDRGRDHRPVWERLDDYDLRRLIKEDRASFGLEP